VLHPAAPRASGDLEGRWTSVVLQEELHVHAHAESADRREALGREAGAVGGHRLGDAAEAEFGHAVAAGAQGLERRLEHQAPGRQGVGEQLGDLVVAAAHVPSLVGPRPRQDEVVHPRAGRELVHLEPVPPGHRRVEVVAQRRARHPGDGAASSHSAIESASSSTASGVAVP
jgi:hypothetical protein